MRPWLVASMLAAQVTAAVPPAPVDPVAAIVDAFRTHDIVAVTDPHGNEQMHAFLLAVLRDPRFGAVADDVVMETASARYQDAIDRFVRGEDVPGDVLRKAWEDHTMSEVGTQTQAMIRAVRAVNAARQDARRLRVIAGDPPIDWDNITTKEDHRRWVEQRDTYPADVIRRLVLDRGRHALVIYGQGHLQRRQIASNYDMSTWQAQTVVSVIERDSGRRVFNVWSLLDRNAALPDVGSWPVPSLAVIRGTTLGARDFGEYDRGIGDGIRFAVRNDQLLPMRRDEWKTMRMDDQFDALLYLGPPTSLTVAPLPAAVCQDTRFVDMRLQRLALFAPPVEIDRFRNACGR